MFMVHLDLMSVQFAFNLSQLDGFHTEFLKEEILNFFAIVTLIFNIITRVSKIALKNSIE